MIRFNLEKLMVEDPIDGVVFSAIYQGISPNEPMMRKLAWRQPNNLQNLLDKVEEFINEEETLKVIRLAQKEAKLEDGWTKTFQEKV